MNTGPGRAIRIAMGAILFVAGTRPEVFGYKVLPLTLHPAMRMDEIWLAS